MNFLILAASVTAILLSESEQVFREQMFGYIMKDLLEKVKPGNKKSPPGLDK